MREYTRAEVAFWSDPDPDEPIEPAADLPPGDAYNFVLAGLARAHWDCLLTPFQTRWDKKQAFKIECLAEELNWRRTDDQDK